MADYVALLRELASIEPPLFVFGGIADAALLDGRLGPSHGDLDVLTPRNKLERTVEQLLELGFDSFEVFYEPRPGLPWCTGARAVTSCSSSACLMVAPTASRTSSFRRTQAL